SAPPVVSGAYGFLLLLASLRLVVPLVDPGLRRIAWGLAVWYALDRLRDRLVPDPFASRLLVLAGACVAVAVLAWLLRPARVARLGQLTHRRGWLRAIGVGMRLALLLNAAAIACSVLGNATLAELLVEGTLASAWYAFIAFAFARVLVGAWSLLLRSRPAQALYMVRHHGPLLRSRGRALIHTALALAWAWMALAASDAGAPLLQRV